MFIYKNEIKISLKEKEKKENLHQRNTRHAKQNSVILSQQSTDSYDIKSIQYQSAPAWNKLQKETNHNILKKVLSNTKEYITNKILNSY